MKGIEDTGIKCPKCESTLHEVKATRKRGSTVVRVRECYNGHRFRTVETAIHKQKREKVRGKVLALLRESRKYPQRDPRHKTVEQIADKVGVSSYTVFRIARGEIAVRQVRRKFSMTSL